jgi:hypothetical protein
MVDIGHKDNIRERKATKRDRGEIHKRERDKQRIKEERLWFVMLTIIRGMHEASLFFFEPRSLEQVILGNCFVDFLLHSVDIASRLCVLHEVGIGEPDGWYIGLHI